MSRFPFEAAGRLSIRELAGAYAYGADRRDTKGQMAPFTKDAHSLVCMDAKNPGAARP